MQWSSDQWIQHMMEEHLNTHLKLTDLADDAADSKMMLCEIPEISQAKEDQRIMKLKEKYGKEKYFVWDKNIGPIAWWDLEFKESTLNTNVRHVRDASWIGKDVS